MKLRIENKVQLDEFINLARINGHTCVGIKGCAPEGATFSDGTPIETAVNIAWKNVVTEEVVPVIYCKNYFL